MGHEFTFWRPHELPIFDAFDMYFKGQSDCLFLGTTYGADEAVVRCLEKYPDVRVGMFASVWGRMGEGIDTSLYPIDMAKEEEKQNIERLFKNIARPDFVFLHCVPSYLEGLLGYWKNIGPKIASIMNAADIMVYRPVEPVAELACDGAMVGGYWPYKAKNLDAYIFPLVQTGKQYNVKIFGNSRWPIPQYLGQISLQDEVSLYSSAKVCLNTHEPHSNSLAYDCVERPAKTAACGGAVLSDYVEGWNEILENRIMMAKTPKEFEEMFIYLLENSEYRNKYAKTIQREIISKHTYHHRVSQFFRLLCMNQEADNCLRKCLEFIEK